MMKSSFYTCITGIVTIGLLASFSHAAIAQSREKREVSLHLSDIQMSNRLTGWGEQYSGGNIELLSTHDGGHLWRLITDVPGDAPLQFEGGGQAWYATRSGGKSPYARIHVTADWGTNWSVSPPLRLPVGHSDRLQLTLVPNGHTGWLAVTAGGMNSSQTLQLWRTTNGGTRWRLISGADPTDFLLGFENSTKGWGEWSHAGSPFAAEFIRPSHAQPSEPPALFRTTDAGRTWQPQYLPVPHNLVADNGLAALTGKTWFGQHWTDSRRSHLTGKNSSNRS